MSTKPPPVTEKDIRAKATEVVQAKEALSTAERELIYLLEQYAHDYGKYSIGDTVLLKVSKYSDVTLEEGIIHSLKSSVPKKGVTINYRVSKIKANGKIAKTFYKGAAFISEEDIYPLVTIDIVKDAFAKLGNVDDESLDSAVAQFQNYVNIYAWHNSKFAVMNRIFYKNKFHYIEAIKGAYDETNNQVIPLYTLKTGFVPVGKHGCEIVAEGITLEQIQQSND